MPEQAKWFQTAVNKSALQHGLNQEKISRLAGIDPEEFTLMVNGDLNVPRARRQAVAQVFGCSLEDFLKLGRSICEAEALENRPPALPPWLAPYLDDLADLNEDGREAVMTLLEALRKK